MRPPLIEVRMRRSGAPNAGIGGSECGDRGLQMRGRAVGTRRVPDGRSDPYPSTTNNYIAGLIVHELFNATTVTVPGPQILLFPFRSVRTPQALFVFFVICSFGVNFVFCFVHECVLLGPKVPKHVYKYGGGGGVTPRPSCLK